VRAPLHVPGRAAALRTGGSERREGQEGHSPAGACAVDFDAYPLSEADQPQTAGVERRPIEGQLRAVVEQHSAGPRRRVEGPYRCLHPPLPHS
jgi:hypothetical protein